MHIFRVSESESYLTRDLLITALIMIRELNIPLDYVIMFSKAGKWGECQAYFNILRDGVLNRRPKGLETREPAENQMADYYDMLLKERLPLGKGRRSTVLQREFTSTRGKG